MSVRKRFHANIRKSDLPMVNLKWNVTQKLDPTLEPSNYKQLPKIRMFSAENSICPPRFIIDGPELLHTCSTCMSIPRRYLRGMLFIFAEYIWSHVVRTYTCIPYMSRRRVPNHKPVWELRTSATPPPILCFPLNRRQISSDVTSSPLLRPPQKHKLLKDQHGD